MPVVVKALRKLNVPVTVVADFDILNNVNPLKDLYIDLGGNWDDVENDWKLVKDEIDRKRPELQSKDLKEEICFYDKVVLNKMIEVDINQEFQKNGILIISNINFEKFFLKNSLDIITGLASDKIYSNALKIMNSIINEESYRENIFIKIGRAHV